MAPMFDRRREFLASSLLLLGLELLALRRDVHWQTRDSWVSGRLHAQRSAATDLEVGGDLAGLPAGSTRYITRGDLLALPNVSYRVSDDPNFGRPTRVKGVLLERLPGFLGAADTANLVVAICNDKYRTNYSIAYMARHHPLLVLEINGQPPAGWPKDASGGGFDMGPYLISHAQFVPGFRILAHSDEAQIPWGVVRLEFRNPASVFGAIAPPRAASDPIIDAGYRIAQQNCFRCHNLGAEGGQKSGVPWEALAQVATASSEWFSDYVRDPRAKNPRTQMPGNPDYDHPTLHALVSYFRTFKEMPPDQE
jgi:mono/diheme cytochrome c family protein